MKRYYEVFCKDRLSGGFWTVSVVANTETKLTDILEYATMKTFGMDAFGVKEVFANWCEDAHGKVTPGLNF